MILDNKRSNSRYGCIKLSHISHSDDFTSVYFYNDNPKKKECGRTISINLWVKQIFRTNVSNAVYIDSRYPEFCGCNWASRREIRIEMDAKWHWNRNRKRIKSGKVQDESADADHHWIWLLNVLT